MGAVGRVWLVFAGINAAVAVAAGAYASHALAAPGLEKAQEWARTAGQYQLWHALALLAAALLATRAERAARLALGLAGWLFLAGTVLFCGTLYALAFHGPLPVPNTAPLGGSAFMLGWGVLALSAILPGWREDHKWG
ncbi:MAG TPA: DUF423 domain-containing protein [Azospirillum sp.]|nr:DUF423 domain-containing protein [Azospirillum sp.]